MNALAQLLEDSAAQFPDRVAVAHPEYDLALSYAQFLQCTDAIAHLLDTNGVLRGSRIGIGVRKSIASLSAVFGALRADCSYVPVGFDVPKERMAYIFEDCEVAAVFIEHGMIDILRSVFTSATVRSVLEFDAPSPLDVPMDVVFLQFDTPATVPAKDRQLSYILYTSGSTGLPKGVVHSVESAMSFINWCSTEFQPTPDDRFASHAPFHFDLSILDIFVPLRHGASVVLFGEELGKQPLALAAGIEDTGITVWYSTPSILRLLVDFGKLEHVDASSLRLVLFAGEVFPIRYLRRLMDMLPQASYYNLYGPTETNVCTFYKVPPKLAESQTEPVPIGVACSGDRVELFDETGRPLSSAESGELCASGGSVMVGYWRRPELDDAVFFNDTHGTRWYRTGDICDRVDGGNFRYIARRDRMVKRRGYRIELGEIEQALYRRADIAEAAVVALDDEDDGVRIEAFIVASTGEPLSTIALKKYCGKILPKYMIPDKFIGVKALPKTKTHKVDYQSIKAGTWESTT